MPQGKQFSSLNEASASRELGEFEFLLKALRHSSELVYEDYHFTVNFHGSYHLDIASTTGRFGALRDRQMVALSRYEAERHPETAQDGREGGGMEGRHGQISNAQDGIPAVPQVRAATWA